jgi:hypothetical protein
MVRMRIRIRTFLKSDSDPDPVKNRPDPQHCYEMKTLNLSLVQYTKPLYGVYLYSNLDYSMTRTFQSKDGKKAIHVER